MVSRNVTMGQTVAASFQTPTLFLIATDLTKMQVDTNVSESDIGGIKENNPANFTGRRLSRPPVRRQCRPGAASAADAQNVVTFDVVVGVANPDLLLMPGMTATTKIVTAQRDNVIRVPDQALRYVPADAAAAAPQPVPGGAARQGQVWVLADGKPVRVAVTLGLDDDSFTEIVGGDLKPGDQVILSEQAGGSGKSAVPLPRL